MADIVANIDLNNTRHNLVTTCTMPQAFYKKYQSTAKSSGAAVSSLSVACRFAIGRFNTVLSLLSTKEIKKRFVGIVAAAMLAAGVGGYILGDSHDHSGQITALETNQRHLVASIHSLVHQGSLNAENIRHIEAFINDDSVRHTQEEAVTREFIAVSQNVQSVLSEIDPLMTSLESLISTRSLPAGLFKNQGLEDLLRKMGVRAKQHGLVPAASRPVDLFHFPISYALIGFTFRVFVHVPLTLSPVQLLMLLPSPILVKNSLYTVHPQETYITHGDAAFSALTKTQLEQCIELSGHRYVCYAVAVYKAEMPVCLHQLVSNQQLSACHLKAVAERPAFWRPSSSAVIVYFPKKSEVRLYCQGTLKHHEMVEGAKRVYLPENCDLDTDYYRVPHSQFHITEKLAYVPSVHSIKLPESVISNSNVPLHLKHNSRSYTTRNWSRSRLHPTSTHT